MIRPYSAAELNDLVQLPKKVTDPRARWSEKPTVHPVHRQRTFLATGATAEGVQLRFLIYQRQSLLDRLNYSCGIVTWQEVERRSHSPGTTEQTTGTKISATNLTFIE